MSEEKAEKTEPPRGFNAFLYWTTLLAGTIILPLANKGLSGKATTLSSFGLTALLLLAAALFHVPPSTRHQPQTRFLRDISLVALASALTALLPQKALAPAGLGIAFIILLAALIIAVLGLWDDKKAKNA